jgi:hypothetical protein
MREIAHNWISPVRIKVNASRIAAATASAAQSEDRSANQKTTFFDSIDPSETCVGLSCASSRGFIVVETVGTGYQRATTVFNFSANGAYQSISTAD